MSEFGKSKGGGRRSAPRVKAPVLAVLSTVTEDYRAAVINVSGIGARLSAPQLPTDNEEVIFRADNVQAFGHVVWSHDGQCGVSFEGPISASEVDRLRSQANNWSLAGLSAEDRAAAERWEMGIGA